MKWIKLTLHFPSFFSYRIPDYSSQYALSVPLPSPSVIKLALIATAIRASGRVVEGERVFDVVRDAEVRIAPPERITINLALIRRLKKKKNPTKRESIERTFGVREYVFFSEDLNVFIGGDRLKEVTPYVKMIRYIGSGDSIVYVKDAREVNDLPQGLIKAVDENEFGKIVSEDSYIVYPIKDFSKKAKFEHINPYSPKSSKNVFVRKFYLLKAKVQKGKNWKMLTLK